MTDPRMALAELIEKGGDADFLKDVLAFSLPRLMDMEAEAACGVLSEMLDPGERGKAGDEAVPDHGHRVVGGTKA